MTNGRKCDQCGRPLPVDAPGGLCPRCLMALNLSMETDVPHGAKAQGAARVTGAGEEPPPVAEMAGLFPQLEILRCLGRGGMGFVYLARQPRLDRMVALKVLARTKEADPHFADRFGREARALARLNHPNIVAVYDFGDVQGHYYLLIEFVDGVNLRQLLQDRKVTPEQALAIVPRICEALQYAHEQGVVHRDIKPENILVDKQGRVKIADFGIAKLLDPSRNEARLTEERQVIGTPHYMAPEQIENPQKVDHRADIYSLGVVFYEMLTGELPLGKFAPPSRKAAIDARLDEVVLHALEKEPEQRYQHANEVRTDVETIVARDRRPEATDWVRSTARSGRLLERWMPFQSRGWPLVLAVVLGLAALAVLLRQQSPFLRGHTEAGHGEGDIVFPADAGVIDVTRPPYNAKADGRTDSTAAIQQALKDFRAAHAIIYLPNGVYLISDTLRWGEGLDDPSGYRRLTLQGQSSGGTIIRLKDGCSGFEQPATPKAVIWTGPKGEDRYFNSIRNLTVDTGTNNPGAIGVQFCASFVGCMRDVVIRSGDGQGVVGLDMAYADGAGGVGPLLIKNVAVRGFDTGIHTKGVMLSQTFEHIRLEDQNEVGFLNEGQSVSIRGLRTKGAVPGFRNEANVGLAVIVDSKFQGIGAAKDQTAIFNRPGLFVRNTAVEGFAQAIIHTGSRPANVSGPLVKEWGSRALPGSGPSLNLPVKETPEVPWDPADEWANPIGSQSNSGHGEDDSEAIQRAIDSGKRTVYLPRGEYLIRRPIQLRGRVRRFIGCEAVLRTAGSDKRQPMFTVGTGDAPVVVVERLRVDAQETVANRWFIDNQSSRTLVLRDCDGVQSEFTGPGEVFLENVGGRMTFHGQRVWARQINQTTSSQIPADDWWHLRNHGGQLWVLGDMTAGPGPVLLQTGISQAEVLGGLIYASAMANAQPDPAFVLEEGALSVSINEVSYLDFTYPVLVRRNAKASPADLLLPAQAQGGINASLIPLFSTE